ncbi:hypothetical protein CWI39_3606p0010 [Hamiltosporidium magnivora]|uniref:t-SNARE coiled-coil homology domain-containing protein n=1 Tax=Hamiltosporidium magnivora TaxID=148818 RepID=A0A4V2JTJ8_9MICR|nr:hypothetical protein CWI39_3606p0010 [Hamiltosporidium magnivora]
MDRSKEFMAIVTSTFIPQNSFRNAPSHFKNFFMHLEKISINLKEIEKGCINKHIYEDFTFQEKIETTQILIEDLKKNLSNFIFEAKNEQEELNTENIKEMIRNRLYKNAILLSKYLNRIEEQKKNEKLRRNRFSAEQENRTVSETSEANNQLQTELLIEENEIQNLRERVRENIALQINELGQVVSDISLHVSMQGENLKRIDDLMGDSRGFVQKSTHEINKTWNMIRNRRNTFIKFFGFWIFLAFVFWILKKM